MYYVEGMIRNPEVSGNCSGDKTTIDNLQPRAFILLLYLFVTGFFCKQIASY